MKKEKTVEKLSPYPYCPRCKSTLFIRERFELLPGDVGLCINCACVFKIESDDEIGPFTMRSLNSISLNVIFDENPEFLKHWMQCKGKIVQKKIEEAYPRDGEIKSKKE